MSTLHVMYFPAPSDFSQTICLNKDTSGGHNFILFNVLSYVASIKGDLINTAISEWPYLKFHHQNC